MRKFLLLEFGVGLHALFAVTEGQFEHTQVKGMKTGQGDKLKTVPHGAQFPLKSSDFTVPQVAFPVKRRRAVIGQQFVRIISLDALGKSFGLFKVGSWGFTPHQIRVRSVGPAAGNRGFNAILYGIESLGGPVIIDDKRPVTLIDVTGEQPGGIGIGAGDQSGNAADVGGQAGRDQFGDKLPGGHQNLAAEMAALFGGCQLVFKVHPGRPGIDHLFH